MKRLGSLLLALGCGLAATLAPGLPAIAGPDIPEPKVRLLLPGGAPVEGAYQLGLAFDLPPGWHTYWRYPGEAGLPPVLSTEGSDNLAGIGMRYPAPERYDDGFSTSIVYHDRVVFPLAVRPSDPSEPVRFELTVTYGYCREICVPATASLTATLDPADTIAPLAAATIRLAETRVPVPEAMAGLEAPRLVALERRPGDGDKDPGHLLVSVSAGGGGGPVDVFAEGPEGWYLAVPEPLPTPGPAGETVFRLPLKGAPRGTNPTGATLTFTVVSPHAAIEAVRVLD